jgi:hypothetical protein
MGYDTIHVTNALLDLPPRFLQCCLILFRTFCRDKSRSRFLTSIAQRKYFLDYRRTNMQSKFEQKLTSSLLLVIFLCSSAPVRPQTRRAPARRQTNDRRQPDESLGKKMQRRLEWDDHVHEDPEDKTKEAGSRLGISSVSIHRLRKKGLPEYRIGCRVVFDYERVLLWRDKRRK